MSEITVSYKKNEYLWNYDPTDPPDNSSDEGINKQKMDHLYDLSNKHSGSDERYENTMKIYNRQILDLFNISAGIVGCGVFIYYSYIKKPGFT
jgi:hypothetical protein